MPHTIHDPRYNALQAAVDTAQAKLDADIASGASAAVLSADSRALADATAALIAYQS